MKRIEDIDLSKYDAHQLKAVAEIFDAMMSDVPKKSLERDCAEFGSWMTEELDLDLAVKQAQEYAKAVNEGRRHRSDFGASDADKEISAGVIDWLRRKKRGNRH
jgi:hypothetical protein